VTGGFAENVAPSSSQRLVRSQGSKASKDADDAERRGAEDVDGVAGVDDFDGAAGVNDVGKGAGPDGRSLLAFVFRCAGPLMTRRKGTGRKTSVVSRASVMSVLPRVSVMSEGHSAAAMAAAPTASHRKIPQGAH